MLGRSFAQSLQRTQYIIPNHVPDIKFASWIKTTTCRSCGLSSLTQIRSVQTSVRETGSPQATGELHFNSKTSLIPTFLSLQCPFNPSKPTIRFALQPEKPSTSLLLQIQEEWPNVKELSIIGPIRDSPEEPDDDAPELATPESTDQVPLSQVDPDLAQDVSSEPTCHLTRWAKLTPLQDIINEAYRSGNSCQDLLFKLDDRSIRIPVPLLSERLKPIDDEISSIKPELEKLEETKTLADRKSRTHANRVLWYTLTALCAQWGLMARLTWWEFSWDVMEPLSFFVAFGTAILGYMFYIVTKRDYTYQVMADWAMTRAQLRHYRRANFDVKRFIQLKTQSEMLENARRKMLKAYGVTSFVVPEPLRRSDDPKSPEQGPSVIPG